VELMGTSSSGDWSQPVTPAATNRKRITTSLLTELIQSKAPA